MAKITLPSIASGYATVTQLNTALDQIEAEFNNKVLYRNNPTGEPNQLENDLDMNSKNINNIGNINGIAASGLSDLSTYATAAANSAIASAASAADSASSANDSLISANNSANSAISSSDSAATAAIYASMGLGGASVFDFGSIADTTIIFPTDWGTVV